MTDDSQSDDVLRLLERGLFYLDCGLTEDAIGYLEQAEALAPDDPRIAQALARVRPEPAREGRVFTVRPKTPSVPVSSDPSQDHDNRVAAFTAAYRVRDWTAAAVAARSLAAADPDDPKAWASLANAERRLGRFDAALDAHDRAIAVSGGDPSHLTARAKTLWEAGRYETAEAAYLELLPRLDENGVDHADAWMSLGMIRMTRGGPAAGVDAFEWRWRAGEIRLPEVAQPYWDGTLQPDKRILFYGEQGFGDAIQFARYVPLIAARCKQVILPCKPPLLRLMRSLKGGAEVCEEKIARDSFDLYVPAMSCMRLFGAAADAIPRGVPYLAAADGDLHRLRPVIAARKGLRVGITWTGSPTNGGDWKRAVDPALFAALGRVPDVVLFSLQKVRDDTPSSLRRLPEGAVDLDPLLNDFADTAAAIECLDLIVTADTSVAHLAGALGKPVWVLIPTVPDWRWMLDRDDSPWYPTLRLYRQRQFADWAEVMARVAADLETFRPRQNAAPENGRDRKGLTRLLPWRR